MSKLSKEPAKWEVCSEEVSMLCSETGNFGFSDATKLSEILMHTALHAWKFAP